MEELINRWRQMAAEGPRGFVPSVRMAVGEGPNEVWSSITARTLLLNPEGTVSYRNPQPLFGNPSLEFEISREDWDERKWHRQPPYAVEFAEVGLPQRVVMGLSLVGAKSNHPSEQHVIRLVTRCGLRIVDRLKEMWRLAFAKKRPPKFDSWLEQEIFDNARRLVVPYAPVLERTISMFGGVADTLGVLAVHTNVPRSTIAIATLVAGLSQSSEWLPASSVLEYAGMVLKFNRTLTRRPRRPRQHPRRRPPTTDPQSTR